MPNEAKSLKEMATKAQERKDIYPKLDFGGDMEEGQYIIRVETPPTRFVNPNPPKGVDPNASFQIVCTLMEPTERQSAGSRVQISTGGGSTMGDGILKCWAAANEQLVGRILQINAVVVPIKKIGNKKQRVYNVIDITESYVVPTTQRNDH